jgi:uncharacterized protein
MDARYRATVPAFIRMLQGLSDILDKGLQYGEEHSISEVELLDTRLAVDQFPLVKQIQIATDNAKNGSAKLAGVEAPRFADDEQSVAELKERLLKTVMYLQTLKPEQFSDSDSRHIALPYFPGKYITGEEYLHHYLLPNFYFHAVTAYDILRHIGVPLQKGDYLKGVVFHDL